MGSVPAFWDWHAKYIYASIEAIEATTSFDQQRMLLCVGSPEEERPSRAANAQSDGVAAPSTHFLPDHSQARHCIQVIAPAQPSCQIQRKETEAGIDGWAVRPALAA